MSEEYPKFVLYQKWHRRKMSKYGTYDVGTPTKMLSVFPGNREGLDEAIAAAERPDAILVKLTEACHESQRLIDFVEDLIGKKKFVRVFHPVYEMPGG